MANVNLRDAVIMHQALCKYRNEQYINLIQQINTKTASILKDDMGSQFIQNCGRDIAGEIVRNYFDTSNYNITVDQLAMRILKFSYDNEYDPLAKNGSAESIKKSVYNNNELKSAELERIGTEMDSCQAKLFQENRATDRLDATGKKAYRESKRDANGELHDELTGRKGKQTTIQQNGRDILKSDLHADHVQSREAARYNSKYITHNGVDKLKIFWNSSDNMQLMHASANTSKGDIRVCNINGEIKYLNTKDAEYKDNCDITHKATPEQLTEATVQQWQKGKADSPKIQKLIDEGYLQKDENGNITVPKSVRKALENNIKHSQNEESKIILKNTKYGEVAKDATKHTKAAIGQIIAGQIIYYTAPPLVYEIRTILQNKKADLDEVIKQLCISAKRMGNYVLSKLKDIFSNILFHSLKKFVKVFMDILIEAVKATVKRLLKIAKNLVLSTVDAIRIIADKNTSVAEKADSVFNLFAVTVTSCVIDVLFEIMENTLKIPHPYDEIVFGPLQVLTTVVCTNLTMLVLQKADLFDVRFGFKINAIKKVFEEERVAFEEIMNVAESFVESEIQTMIQYAKEDCKNISKTLEEVDLMRKSVKPYLQNVGEMFSLYIDYDEKWNDFIGRTKLYTKYNSGDSLNFSVNYATDLDASSAIAITYLYFAQYDLKLKETILLEKFISNKSNLLEIETAVKKKYIVFSEVRRFLDKVSNDVLVHLKTMIATFMQLGAGAIFAKEAAKENFDKYFKARGVFVQKKH